MDGWSIIETIRIAVQGRAEATRQAYPSWPCRLGCDDCCRSLAKLPELNPLEWREVERGVAELPAPVREAVEQRITAAAGRADTGPYVCPFLDPAAGACLIYAHRPVACRTYGYYVDSRGVGLYCDEIRQREEGGEFAAAVWGNQDAVEARLDALGPRVSFAVWAQSRG